MEKVFNKTMERGSNPAIYANQLLTVNDRYQFKKQLLDELISAIKNNGTYATKKGSKRMK